MEPLSSTSSARILRHAQGSIWRMLDDSRSETNLGIDGFVVSGVTVDVSLHLALRNDAAENVNRAEIAIECPLRLRSSDWDDMVETDAQGKTARY